MVETKKYTELPPCIVKAVVEKHGHLGDTDPLISFMRDAYNDGLDGVNEENYPEDFDVAAGEWCEVKGKHRREMTAHEVDVLGRLLKLERLCWEMGRAEAGKGATA